MEQPIARFHQDQQAHWVAELACGHTQHMRHVPPWQLRPWVLTEAGRAAMIGARLNCTLCEMGKPPASATPYKQTPRFTEASVPDALLREHRTKRDVWARIVVEQGKLAYHCGRGVFVLRPGVDGIVEPEEPHHVRPLGSVRFHVVFLRVEAR
jgi:tellurite methyltransferase